MSDNEERDARLKSAVEGIMEEMIEHPLTFSESIFVLHRVCVHLFVNMSFKDNQERLKLYDAMCGATRDQLIEKILEGQAQNGDGAAMREIEEQLKLRRSKMQ